MANAGKKRSKRKCVSGIWMKVLNGRGGMQKIHVGWGKIFTGCGEVCKHVYHRRLRKEDKDLEF